MKFNILPFAYSERYIEASKHVGTAMITDIAVTHKVPAINGNIPNFPFIGCHSVDVIKFQKEFSLRIGNDFNKRFITISSNNKASSIEIININLLANLSFTIFLIATTK
jgi:hypothetical protein